MDPQAMDFLSRIRSLCRAHGVARLDLLRSGDPKNGDPHSNAAEFVVAYRPDRVLDPWLADFFAFHEELAATVGRPMRLSLATPTRDGWLARSGRDRRVLYDAGRDGVTPLKAA